MTWNSSEMPLPPWMSRAKRAMSSALPQLFRLRSDTAPGAARPSSNGRRPRRGRAASLSDRPARPERRMQAERDLGLHVGELLLDQLIGGERPAELLALEHVLAGAGPRKIPAPPAAPRE